MASKKTTYLLIALCMTSLWASAQMTIFPEPLSPRIANYRINVAVDVPNRRIKATQMILWHNKTNQAAPDLRLHLYLNGFRNSNSSWMKEARGAHKGEPITKHGYGFSEIRTIKILQTDHAPIKDGSFSNISSHPTPSAMTDVTDRLRFLAPDDNNINDRSFAAIALDQEIKPSESIWIYIEYDAGFPKPPYARTGAVDEFLFAGQWFPKVSVFEDGSWTNRQFHHHSEFYADFGVYDVFMTVPAENLLGATGLEVNVTDNGDGTKTHYYHAEDVHDFAFTTSPRYVEAKAREQDVDIRLLIQEDHAHQTQRHLDAAKFAVRIFQDTYGDYPFPNLTVIDPSRDGDGAGGMEYPTLITVGTKYNLPEGVGSVEAILLHEFGHNYWYHLLASNEFDESWLDEGINTYTDLRLSKERTPYPYVDWKGFKLDPHAVQRASYMGNATIEETLKPGYQYYSYGSYSLNSYSKPGVFLMTLANHIGEETMDKILRTYVKRWSFKHPKSQDFIDIVNEVTGENYQWFFDQALLTNHVIDYSVRKVQSKRKKPPVGYDLDRSVNDLNISPQEKDPNAPFVNTVRVRRLGQFTFPVEVAFYYADGSETRETWDGRDYWKIFSFESEKRLIAATVDPDHKVLMDMNHTNNSKTNQPDSKPFVDFTSNWLVRLQMAFDFLSL